MLTRWKAWGRRVCLGVGLLGCDPEITPGLELTVLVQGNVEPGERAQRIDLVFDRGMVADPALGRELTPEEAPFRLRPSVAGTLRWREDRRLSFEPAQPLPRATAFVVTVPRGTRAPDHVGLTEDYEYRFSTERLTLVSTAVRGDSLPDPKRWATPDQMFELTFNQPVAPEQVSNHCGFSADDGALRVAVRRLEAGPVAGGLAGEKFAVAPGEPLRAGTAWRFACDGNLAPVEGPLPLTAAERSPDASGELPDGDLDFRTYGPFQAESITPAGQGVNPDEHQIAVRFSTPPMLLEPGNPIGISPDPEAVSEEAYVRENELVARVSGLNPHTSYTLSVGAGLKDAFAQTLAEPFSASFRTGPARPAYTLDTGSWAVEASREGYVAWTRNVRHVEVIAASLSEEQLLSVLPRLNWWDRDAVDLAAAKIPSRRKRLSVSGEADRYNQLLLTPKGLLGDAAQGSRFYYIASRSPEVLESTDPDDPKQTQPQGYSEVLLNVTNLGLTSKLSGNSGLVWVTRLSDGAPQPGAEVVIRERSGRLLWKGNTGADGTASVPGRAALLAKSVPAAPAAAESAEGEGEGESAETGNEAAGLLIFARSGTDETFVDPDRAGRFSSWNFGVSNDVLPTEVALRGFIHTDRGLYRPGDTVHLRGLARHLQLGGGLFVPAHAEAEVIVSDPRDRELARRRVPLSRFGGFSVDEVLPEVAALGDYRVRAVLPHGEFSETFTVEEFRPATFEVELNARAPFAFAGQSLSLSTRGRYFYGAAVRSANVTFAVHSRARSVEFPGYEDYSFMEATDPYDSTEPYGEESLISEQTAKLDDQGQAEQVVQLPAEQFVGPSTLLISATVQDETNQTVSANLTLPLHQTRLYLGIDSGGWVAPAKEPQRVKFIALSPEGKAMASHAKYRVEKRDWSCAWERWGYLGSYRCEPKPELVAEGSVSLGAAAPLEQAVTYPSPGEYLLSLEGVDANNEPVRASRSVWVFGDGDSAWRADDTGRFQIIADKHEYHVGDTAKLIVQAPTEGATALLSIERDGVLSHRLLPELTPGQAIEVPITDAFAPNAFVSVLLVRGRSGEGARGLPQASMGLVNLPVSHEDKRLQVDVQTDQAQYRPGSPVTARLRVTDMSGKPVQAEVALAAADEGVLSLIDFKTPDPLATFFAPWGLAVNTASQYERLTQIPAPDQERYVTGGDGAGMPGSFRSRFRATAYWNAAVVTDAEGQASVQFEAPDNLTAFRLMAVAADAGDHFGSGDRRFVVNKPVQLLSALPRFASVGDHFEAAALLTNESGTSGVAHVRLFADGAVTLDGQGANGAPLTQDFPLAAGARQRVAFPVTATAPGTARFRFAASLAGHDDGLELGIPVHYPTTEESTLLSEGATQDRVNVAVQFPEGVLPGSAHLDISVDPDGLAGIEDTLRDLIQYPYGCLEQTTSRLIPLVAAQELTRTLRLPELEGEKLERYIRIALAKIVRHQTQNGGFGLWPGSQPDPYLTSYALWGMKLASDAGHALDHDAVERAIGYLRRQLAMDPAENAHSTMGELSSRAFALYVMALLGQPEPDAVSALATRAEALPFYGQAFLARALAATVGASHASVTALLDGWASTPGGKGSGTLVNERPEPGLDWYFSSHVRTSAIVTDALLALRPDDARIPGLIRGLLDQRRADSSWYTTQDNLYALVALTHYARARAGENATVTVARGSTPWLSEPLTGPGLSRIRHLEIPVEAGDTQPLSIGATEGTVHYRVRARFIRDSAHQPAEEHGIQVRRVFLDPETGNAVERATEGQMLRVQLTLSAPTEQTRVALSDFLPAGLEPINTRFATVPSDLEPDDPEWYDRLWLAYRELGDERVDAFVDWMAARPAHFEYLVRATSVGTFVLPAASAQKMYDPDVKSRTALSTFEVIRRP